MAGGDRGVSKGGSRGDIGGGGMALGIRAVAGVGQGRRWGWR